MQAWRSARRLGLRRLGLAQDITIGVAGPMTGQYASFGTQLKNGAEAAVADINAAGGVLGKKLKLEVGDDACDPKQARAVGEKFASQKLPFVAGHYCSSSSIPASDAYAEGGVLQITPASTNPVFTERKLWNTFRVCGRDDQQGTVAGNYIAKHYKGKNIAILQDKSTYGKGLADEMKKALNKAGVQREDVRGLHPGRQGLQRAGVEDEGQQDRRGLCRRLPHRGRPDPAPDARPGHEEPDDLGRRHRHQRVLVDHRARRRRHDVHLRLRSAQAAGRRRGGQEFKDKGIDPEGYTLYTYAAIQIWAAGGQEGQHHRRQEGRGDHPRRQVEHRARPDQLRQEGRHHRGRLRVLPLEQGRQVRAKSRPAKVRDLWIQSD